ncbi:MAG TPA: mannitol dehydrogenase family protein [Caulobacteraceae bacterium]|nr:mannitol dehydrogenase family protein [Caulobacteraceae bacterium]
MADRPKPPSLERLSEAMLGRLPGTVAGPGYDRTYAQMGVVHIGVGAFHRAHQAAFFDDILSSGDRRWSIIGLSLRSPAAEQALQPQDGLYTLIERSAAGETLRVRGAIQSVATVAGRERLALDVLAAAQTQLVSLTISEKGYAPETADLRADVPTTAAGFLAKALERRRNAGLAPFTVLSCDNLDDNGARVRALVLDAASRIDPRLAGWIERNGAFPSGMVDRITPATTPEARRFLENRLGYRDEAMVTTEHFRQWVIEDRFAGPRPDFAAAGVQVVADVIPWQAAKLRLLNAAHSALAYLGGLGGFATVDEAIGWPPLRAYVGRLWDEASSTLSPTPGLDIDAYRQALLRRFENPHLRHRLSQIAMDGSQKLPPRLLATIERRLAAGRSIDALALAVAAWIRWSLGVDEAGVRFEVEDPRAPDLARMLEGADTAAEMVASMLADRAIFSPALAASPILAETLTKKLEILLKNGARAAIAAI